MNLMPLFLYSMWHIFLPGESTPIIFALGIIGTSRKTLVKTALGLALSNGAVMILLLLLGIYANESIKGSKEQFTFYTRVLSSAVFLILGIYFFLQILKTQKDSQSNTFSKKKMLIEKYPLSTGLIIGSIPSLADIGFFLIGANIFAKRINIWPVIGIVWLGVIISFTSVGLIMSILPIDILKKRFNRITKYLYFVASVMLIIISIWMGYSLWNDVYACRGENTSRKWNPLNTFMARHIIMAHRVLIDTEFGAQVVVASVNQHVSVTFSEELISKTNKEILNVLNFETPTKCMPRNEYLEFLNKLHAYLTVTPIR